jgi:hypothetical protein
MDDDKPEAPLDHQEYLKDLRTKLLVKLGLPANTRPERVGHLLEIKAQLDKLGRGNEDD